MKIKSLLIGMLACTALVGCSDDVIEEVESSQSKKMDAYISISINASTNSSRAETYGDGHGSSEDSGHKNEGTTAENAVKQVMVILAHNSDAQSGIVETNASITFPSQSAISNPKTYQVQRTGSYDALIVINPEAGLITDVTNAANPRAAYNAVIGYSYDDVAANNDAAMTNYTKNGFMMANQKVVSIPVDESNNSTSTAATATIDVERAIAKITFRPTNNNIYPVTISKDVYNPITEDGWYISSYTDDETPVAEWSHVIFNRANNNAYWVRVKAGLEPNDLGQVLKKDFSTIFDGIYTIGTDPNEHKGYLDGTETPDYVFTAVGEANWPNQIVLDKGEKKDGIETETYYVKLEKFALTNLAKHMYAVRHKTSNWSNITPLGLLNTNEYIVDPLSEEKNNAISSDTWNDDEKEGDYFFYNDLESVVVEANLLTDKTSTTTYFKDLATLSNDEKQPVTGTTHNVETANPGIGQFMTYCFENGLDQEQQLNGLVTGIIFAGQIYTDEACTSTSAVDVMYKYDGKFYRELRDLLLDNEIEGLTDYSTNDEARNKGIEVYENGKCFYYANQIKHYDNATIVDGERNENGAGIMEFAIMRNNIYSLAIGTISEIGSSTVEPEIGEPAEDTGAYITMQARILPWIVRFNNINF